MNKYYLILDIGGTKTSAALFTENGNLVDDYVYVVKSQTFKGNEMIYKTIRNSLDHIINYFQLNLDDVLGIGVGAPGPLDAEQGVIIGSPMLGMENFPIANLLSKDYGKPVCLDNDGNLGALAEQRCGKGRNMSNVLYMTVSTGCGGGAVLGKEIYHGNKDGAAEFGHISVDMEGEKCPCGGKGCLELYASGTAIKRKMLLDMNSGIKSSVFKKAEFNPEKLDGKVLSEAAEEGDKYALELYKKEGYYLGCALAILFNAFSPDVFVLGGGVTKAKKFFHYELMKQLQERTVLKISDKRVEYSEMNDRVVLYGAYYLIKEYGKKL